MTKDLPHDEPELDDELIDDNNTYYYYHDETQMMRVRREIIRVFIKLLLEAAHDRRLTLGVYKCAKILETNDDDVMLCVLANNNNNNFEESDDDIDGGVHYYSDDCHFTLIKAFCNQCGIDLIKVDSRIDLEALLDGALTPSDDEGHSTEGDSEFNPISSQSDTGDTGDMMRPTTSTSSSIDHPSTTDHTDYSCLIVEFPPDNNETCNEIIEFCKESRLHGIHHPYIRLVDR